MAPRPFQGVVGETEAEQYVLDGQQRITAGLALYHGDGGSHYFLDLDRLWELLSEYEVDIGDPAATRDFANRIDDGDGYVSGGEQRVDQLSSSTSAIFFGPRASQTTLNFNGHGTSMSRHILIAESSSTTVFVRTSRSTTAHWSRLPCSRKSPRWRR